MSLNLDTHQNKGDQPPKRVFRAPLSCSLGRDANNPENPASRLSPYEVLRTLGVVPSTLRFAVLRHQHIYCCSSVSIRWRELYSSQSNVRTNERTNEHCHRMERHDSIAPVKSVHPPFAARVGLNQTYLPIVTTCCMRPSFWTALCTLLPSIRRSNEDECRVIVEKGVQYTRRGPRRSRGGRQRVETDPPVPRRSFIVSTATKVKTTKLKHAEHTMEDSCCYNDGVR